MWFKQPCLCQVDLAKRWSAADVVAYLGAPRPCSESAEEPQMWTQLEMELSKQESCEMDCAANGFSDIMVETNSEYHASHAGIIMVGSPC